jgi:hypothetical protein
MPSPNADPMLRSLKQLAEVLEGVPLARVQAAIRLRRSVLRRRRARRIRAFAQFLPTSR